MHGGVQTFFGFATDPPIMNRANRITEVEPDTWVVVQTFFTVYLFEWSFVFKRYPVQSPAQGAKSHVLSVRVKTLRVHVSPRKIFSIRAVISIEILQVIYQFHAIVKILYVYERMRRSHCFVVFAHRPIDNRNKARHQSVDGKFFCYVISAVQRVFKRQIKFVAFCKLVHLPSRVVGRLVFEASSKTIQFQAIFYQLLWKSHSIISVWSAATITDKPNGHLVLVSQQLSRVPFHALPTGTDQINRSGQWVGVFCLSVKSRIASGNKR